MSRSLRSGDRELTLAGGVGLRMDGRGSRGSALYPDRNKHRDRPIGQVRPIMLGVTNATAGMWWRFKIGLAIDQVLRWPSSIVTKTELCLIPGAPAKNCSRSDNDGSREKAMS